MNYEYPSLDQFEHGRPNSRWEELVNPVLTQESTEDNLENERLGCENWVSIDWATAVSEDTEVKLGVYRSGEQPMGIIVAVEGMEDIFWIRQSYGDICKFADNEIEMPIPIATNFKERKKLKTILKKIQLTDQRDP